MSRFIFGFVLLSACADFTVCTVATHPRSPAWHRRLRKWRQLARRRLRPVDDGRVPIVPTRIMLGEVIATVAVAPSARGGRGTGGGGSPARKPAHRATFGDFLSAECERLRGGESLSSEAMAVEDAGPAKAEEQDRLKALDASIANLERRAAASRMWLSTRFFGRRGRRDRSSRIRCSPASPPRLFSKRRSQQGKRLSSSSRVCRRKRWI